MNLKILFLAFLFLSLRGFGQIIIYPNAGVYGIGYNRIVPINTLYLPTGCGAPVGKASLNSNPYNNPRQAAIFADTCGHHIYWYHPNDSAWSRIDTGGGGGGAGTVTAVIVSGDTLYYTTSGGNNFTAVILQQLDSNSKYVTPTYLNSAIATALAALPGIGNSPSATSPTSDSILRLSGSSIVARRIKDSAGANVTITDLSDSNTIRYLISSSGGSGGTPANPAAVIGTTMIPGTATTYMRSDAAPPIDQTSAFTPTWPGLHTFTGGVSLGSNLTFPANNLYTIGNNTNAAASITTLSLLSNSTLSISASNNMLSGVPTGKNFTWRINNVTQDSLAQTGQWIWQSYIGNVFAGTVTGGTPDSILSIGNGAVKKVPFSAFGGGGSPALNAYSYYGNLTPSTTTGTSLSVATFNVMDFILAAGPFVDSSTDVTVAFQKAIDTTQAYGGILIVPGHNYITSATLKIKLNIPFTIRGVAGPAITYYNNYAVISSARGSRIINTSLSDTALRNYANGMVIENLQFKNNNPVSTASANVGICLDSAGNVLVRNVLSENFNTDLLVNTGSGPQYTIEDFAAVNFHTYGYHISGEIGEDNGSGRFFRCNDYPTVSTWTATDTAVQIDRGGGMIWQNCSVGGAAVGININWNCCTDVIFDNVSDEANVEAMKLKVAAGQSLSNFIIKGGDYLGTGSRIIDIDATAAGASISSGALAHFQVGGVALSGDTGIYVHGNISKLVVDPDVTQSNVTYPVVNNITSGTGLIDITPPGKQALPESTNMTADLHNGNIITFTQAHTIDTLFIVNSGTGGNTFTIQVGTGTGITAGQLFLGGVASFNLAQVSTSAVYINTVPGKGTEITGYVTANGSYIVTAINTYGWTNNSVPFYGGSLLTQDNANFSYNSGTTTLSLNNLTVANNPIFNTTSTAGYVWTATNSTGSGHWAASAGGGGGVGGPTNSLQYNSGGTQYGSPSMLIDTAHKSGLDLIQFNTTNTNIAGQGLYIKAGTAAISGSTVQYPGTIVQEAQLWNSTAVASQPFSWWQYLTGTGGATINANWNLGYENNGGALTNVMTFVPGTGFGINNTGPGSIFDMIAPSGATSYNMLIRLGSATTNFVNLGIPNATTGSIVLNAGLSAVGASFFDASGNWRFPGHVVSGTQTDPNVSQIFGISTTQPQLQLRYDATHYTNFTTNSSGALVVAPAGIKTILTASVSSAASLNIPLGAGVTTNVAGDLWTQTGQFDYYDGTTIWNLLAFAPLASPTFTGTPAAPTASASTNTTQIATTAMVQSVIVAHGGAAASVTPSFTNTTNIASSSLQTAYYTSTDASQSVVIIHYKVSGTITPSVGSLATVLTVQLPTGIFNSVGDNIGHGTVNVNSGTAFVPGIVTVSTTGVSGVVTFTFIPTAAVSSAFEFDVDYIL